MEIKEVLQKDFAAFLKKRKLSDFLIFENEKNNDVVAVRVRKIPNGKIRLDAFVIDNENAHCVGSSDIKFDEKNCYIYAFVMVDEEQFKGYETCLFNAIEVVAKNNFKDKKFGIGFYLEPDDTEQYEQTKQSFLNNGFVLDNENAFKKYVEVNNDLYVARKNGLKYVKPMDEKSKMRKQEFETRVKTEILTVEDDKNSLKHANTQVAETKHNNVKKQPENVTTQDNKVKSHQVKAQQNAQKEVKQVKKAQEKATEEEFSIFDFI